MNSRARTLRLSMVFTLSGFLTIMYIVRSCLHVPSDLNQYLDIVMAVLMVVLLLCVLELCLGIEVCGGVFCSHLGRSGDVEGRGDDNDPPTPDPSESPPSYEAIMSQGVPATQTGGAVGEGREREGGQERQRERETLSLKRGFSFHFKSLAPNDDRLPPARWPTSTGVRETSFTSPAELYLAVDGLPTYEEAIARLNEEAVTVQEGEGGAVNQQEQGAEVSREESTPERIPEDQEAGQQDEQASAGLQGEGTR